MKNPSIAVPLPATLALVAALLPFAPPTLAYDDVVDGALQKQVIDVRKAQAIAAHRQRLGTSVGTSDTTWIGYTPGHLTAANPWSIYGGSGADGFGRPIPGQTKGMWNWEEPVQGDSLQGWWPYRSLSSESLSGDTDRDRPHTCIDFGNQSNYVINQSRGADWPTRGTGTEPGWRTFGVDGVWHVDGGSTVSVAGVPAPTWSPLAGTRSAWMGLRAHGDLSAVDPLTGNAFNEDVLVFNMRNAARASGTDKRFPGYGSQMDQILYRDIDLGGVTDTSLTISFRYRTNLSTTALTTSRFGWFNHDPLGVTSGGANPQLNNFISGMDAGATRTPVDSFMVYVGAGVDSGQWQGSDGVLHDILDPRHRWFAEVLHCDRDPASSPLDPRPLYHRELLSIAGDRPAVSVSYTISSGILQRFLEKSRLVRVAFRVKTNLFFDDERTGGRTYSSNGAGAAVVDDVRYRIGGGAEVILGDFESPGAIDNHPSTAALVSWKSTGKSPPIFDHPHPLSTLIYQDICGPVGSDTRLCDMNGVVISSGDHDHGDASGGDTPGRSDFDRRNGLVSPTIVFADDDNDPETPNVHGLYGIGGHGGAGDVQATGDYVVHHDVYSGGGPGSVWEVGIQVYPCVVADASPPYPAWGQIRHPGFIFIDGYAPRCLSWEYGARTYGMIRTSNANGIPDSIRIEFQAVQLCYAFGVSMGCSPSGGTYWDNASLKIVDAEPDPQPYVSVTERDWFQDTYPANEAPGLPGNAALFDTTSALIKTGYNISSTKYGTNYYTVPGDSVVVHAPAPTKRMDLVFRVLPGPGNYEPIGDGDQGLLRKVPTSPATVVDGDGTWWDVMRRIPGDFATPGATALHTSASGGWDPNVWSSARCDTAERNLHGLGGPPFSEFWMGAWHEADARYDLLGISKNRCFVINPAMGPNWGNIICSGTPPAWAVGVPGTTKESTKIIPDGLLTPGAHVEYFFRAQDVEAPGTAIVMLPDTNVVTPQAAERSLDMHRWQEFSVLPDRWKDPLYFHPVLRRLGRGPACLLVVDWNDTQGDEGIWVSVADTIGATDSVKFGAHNGWHAAGGQDVNDPSSFVARHGGSPGTTWDLYQVRYPVAYSTGNSGSLGARLSYRGGDPLIADKTARTAPTQEMMEAYYSLMLCFTGVTGLGPNSYERNSNDDVAALRNWLGSGNTAAPDRGIWMIGDYFVESYAGSYTYPAQYALLYDTFGVGLLSSNYQKYSGVSDPVVHLRVFGDWQQKSVAQLHGMRNQCVWSNDVLTPVLALATPSSQYESQTAPVDGHYAGVFKRWDPSSPYLSLIEGYNVSRLTSVDDRSTTGRSLYFWKTFTNVWAQIWNVVGPIAPLDVPGLEGEDFAAFIRLLNNPVERGHAAVQFGLPGPDRVEARIYDVGGRLVRVLADREFAAGRHELVWDGQERSGRRAPRGVYFVELAMRRLGVEAYRKITVLK